MGLQGAAAGIFLVPFSFFNAKIISTCSSLSHSNAPCHWVVVNARRQNGPSGHGGTSKAMHKLGCSITAPP